MQQTSFGKPLRVHALKTGSCDCNKAIAISRGDVACDPVRNLLSRRLVNPTDKVASLEGDRGGDSSTWTLLDKVLEAWLLSVAFV